MLSIIIPTLNEEEGIAKVLCSIPKEIWSKSEVIVVDVSNDLTPIIAERLGAKVIKANKRGKGWQMRWAVKQSHGDMIVFLDGDGTDPAEYIPKLIEKLKNANLVLGCRSWKKFRTDDPKMRNFFRFYSLLAAPFHLIGIKTSDPLAGFRAIRRKDWEKLQLKSNGFEIETEMNIQAAKNNFIVKEVLIPNLRRCGGLKKSKFGANPKAWLKISKMLLEYLAEKNKLTNK